MNKQLMIVQIGGAINALKGIQSSAGDLPKRHREKIMGLNHIASVIYGLELAKAELTGEAAPAMPVSTVDNSDLDGIIDE